MLTSIFRASIFFMFTSNLASCAPTPHVVHLRPAVSGIVLDDKKPIPGVELFLGKFPGQNLPCSDVGEVVPVSPDGNFSWAATQELKLTESLLSPAAARGKLTVLCIRHPTKGVLIGAVLFIKETAPASLRLVCDVAHPHSSVGGGANFVSTMLGQAQYCEAAKAE